MPISVRVLSDYKHGSVHRSLMGAILSRLILVTAVTISGNDPSFCFLVLLF